MIRDLKVTAHARSENIQANDVGAGTVEPCLDNSTFASAGQFAETCLTYPGHSCRTHSQRPILIPVVTATTVLGLVQMFTCQVCRARRGHVKPF